MPIPKPKAGESQDDFVSRCMENDTMKEEYPDKDQRLAICHSQWEKKEDSLRETRSTNTWMLDTEMRVIKIGDAPVLEGYAAKFDKLSDDLMGFKEKIKPGAFKATIKKDDIRALWDHDSKYVLGRNRAKTLELEEDDVGLRMRALPPDTQWAKDLMKSVDRGDISQMSFGFITLSDTWEKKDGENIRILEKVSLFDVSVVTYPAYPDTSVAMRSWKIFSKGEPTPPEEKKEDMPTQSSKGLEVFDLPNRKQLLEDIGK